MVVIATATRYLEKDSMRYDLACLTIKAAVQYDIPIVVVDGGSPNAMVKHFKSLGAYVFGTIVKPMGQARRTAIAEALKITDEEGLVIWLEPEKYDLVRSIRVVESLMSNAGADIVIPRREIKQWQATYPVEQWYLESAFNVIMSYVLGVYFDFSFGPKFMSRRAAVFFLDYAGEYGDLWEGLVIPVIRAKNAGLKIIDVQVGYCHPSEQKHNEEGNPEFIGKRIDQMNNLWHAVSTEVNKKSL